MKKEEIVTNLKAIINCEQFLLTGSMALEYLGFKIEVKDIDIKVFGIDNSSIEILNRLAESNPPTIPAKYPDSNVIRFKFDGVDVDIFIEKTKIETNIVTKYGVGVTPLKYIVEAKKKIGRPKDYIQLRNLSKQLMSQEEFNIYLNNFQS